MELSGGRIRLPIRELLALHSRPTIESELWFPTSLGDWVLLADGTHGKVLQTPQVVELMLLGGSRKVYKAHDFISKSPARLSPSFRIYVRFGVDYKHQSIVTGDIPALFEQTIRQRLQEGEYASYMIQVIAQFAQAGVSSLDVDALADFLGEAGGGYFDLQRTIQKICVETCNANGWVIPFTQLTPFTWRNYSGG
ncbi:MAG: hypothetical protein V1753_04590 [Pseudomonadota bacterium]